MVFVLNYGSLTVSWLFEPVYLFKLQGGNLQSFFVVCLCVLKDENLLPQKFFEVDFPTVVARKIHNIK